MRACGEVLLALYLGVGIGAASACSSHTAPPRGLDASVVPPDAPPACACEPGPHTDRIFLMSDEGELWQWDPRTHEASFVFGPVCAGATPYSMAIDGRGTAWVLMAESLSMQSFDVATPGPCRDSGYVRTDMRFGLFGMAFAARSATDACADLFVHTYDGDGPFSEGPSAGMLGVIDPSSLAVRALAPIDFDGGELSGTGDGRLYAFAGVDPVKLIRYDRESGAELDRIPLDGFRKTNASALAFFGGDLYVFTEAPPPRCAECFESSCGAAYAACIADRACAEDLACAIDQGDVTDSCGGAAFTALMECWSTCGSSCIVSASSRTSEVHRFDLDGTRTLELVGPVPIRVVGAASSPCVPYGPI